MMQLYPVFMSVAEILRLYVKCNRYAPKKIAYKLLNMILVAWQGRLHEKIGVDSLEVFEHEIDQQSNSYL